MFAKTSLQFTKVSLLSVASFGPVIDNGGHTDNYDFVYVYIHMHCYAAISVPLQDMSINTFLCDLTFLLVGWGEREEMKGKQTHYDAVNINIFIGTIVQW